MNAAIVMLSSLAAGGDPAPGCCGAAPPAAVAPAPCDGCGAAKPGLLDKIKGRLCKPKGDCGGCDAGPTNLLDALKGRRAKHHKPAADCGGCDPCATAPAVAAPATTAPADPPAAMPKPSDAPAPKPEVPKELPKTGNPGAVVVPPLPVTPVSGPKLNGANSPD